METNDTFVKIVRMIWQMYEAAQLQVTILEDSTGLLDEAEHGLDTDSEKKISKELVASLHIIRNIQGDLETLENMIANLHAHYYPDGDLYVDVRVKEAEQYNGALCDEL